MSRNYSFLSCVTDKGANIRGSAYGSQEITKLLLEKKYNKINKKFQIFKSELSKAEDNIKEIVLSASNSYLKELESNNFPILLGGDHSCSMSSIMACSKYAKKNNRPFYVLWFDAHADINTKEQSETGNIHGMPVAMLMNIDKSELIIPNEQYLKPSNFNLYGARSIDDEEKKNLNMYNINWINDDYLKCKENILLLLKNIEENAFIHISFDTDCLNPITAPGVSTPVKGGFSIEEALMMLSDVFVDKRFQSLDIMEYNPFYDDKKTTLKQIEKIIDLLFEL